MNTNLLLTLLLLAGTSLPSSAALYIVDNLDLPTPTTSGAQSNYQMQSFTPTVAGIGTSDTIAANSPLPTSVYLESVTFITTPAGTGSTLGSLFVDVYTGRGNGGTYLGSSINSINVAGTAFNTEITWNFDDLVLTNSGSEYSFVFSTDGVAGGSATARLTAANNGGGFVNTYSGGVADDQAAGTSPVPFDSRFQVGLSAIPEPSLSVALLCGLGLVGLFNRRRGK
jgi:hypothetical protein